MKGSPPIGCWGEAKNYFPYVYTELRQSSCKEEEGAGEPPPGYASIDGVFYSHADSPDDQARIEYLVRIMAAKDFTAYQALLYDLAMLIPAEVEEELYRQRNARLREYGFMSYDEAVRIYAPLEIGEISGAPAPLPPGAVQDGESELPIPIAPLALLTRDNMLVRVVTQTEDRALYDRIRIEYADLCNLILAADARDTISDREILAASWMRAGHYLHLALSALYGQNLPAAEQAIRTHTLETIFRLGWGLVVKARNQARKWLSSSWYHSEERDPDFWGPLWGNRLAGLLLNRPQFYDGVTFRDFYLPR